MGPYQHDLVLDLRVGAGNLSIDIMHLLVVGELVDQFKLHLDLLSTLDETAHTAMILDGHHDLRCRFGIADLI